MTANWQGWDLGGPIRRPIQGSMERYRLVGMPASPFSVKIRALMRYRRLAFDWCLRNAARVEELQAAGVRPLIIPALQLPEDQRWQVDSTLIADLLEARHPGQRSVIPPDPALEMACRILEDMADELAPKLVLLYRWHDGEDIGWSGRWVVAPVVAPGNPAALAERARGLHEKQTGMAYWSGLSDQTRGPLERFFRDVITLFETMLARQPFLFGDRPSLADFAWYGQLTQLMTHSLSRDILIRHAPTLTGWIAMMEDLSGWEGEWQSGSAPIEPVQELLKRAGDFYLPGLLANQRAEAAGEERWQVPMYDGVNERGTYPYQVKCLEALRARYRDLAPAPDSLLAATGCLAALIETG